MARRIEDISGDLLNKLRHKVQEFEGLRLALGEGNDTNDTAQLLNVIRGVRRTS
jgi:hypothetical protein